MAKLTFTTLPTTPARPSGLTFSGRCRASDLKAQAARAAAQAQYLHLHRWRQLNPEAEAVCRTGIERHFGYLLAAMAVLLALVCAFARPEASPAPLPLLTSSLPTSNV